MSVETILPTLYRFTDTCNVYVIAGEDDSIAIDFGSGSWLGDFAELGLPPLARVYLTHHHAEQCAGLEQVVDPTYTIHAPLGEEPFLEPIQVEAFWATRHLGGVKASYDVVDAGIRGVHYDMGGFSDQYWGNRRLRFIHTPGHGPNAITVIADVEGKQIAFCGDAVYEDATIWHPYCLEWDHWQGTGALAAWEGIERLRALGLDMLCPSHGPIIDKRPRQVLYKLANKLMALYQAKGSICPGEKDTYVTPTMLACGARQVLPGLYQTGSNIYLLQSETGDSLVIDPHTGGMDALDDLLAELDRPPVSACTSTHYHGDHTDGIPLMKQRYGAESWLHPIVAEPLKKGSRLDVPFRPETQVDPDHLLPNDGEWTWNEYTFRVAHFPGQTWWHSCLMTEVGGTRVFFGGDSFEPPSRWNGTGGFCAYNGCRFQEGFVPSAQLVLDWAPHLMACGHGTFYRFRRSHFRKILDWAGRAEKAVTALCPSGKLRRDYYLHRH